MARPTELEIKKYLEGYGISKNVISDEWIRDRRDNLIIPWVEKHTRVSFIEEKEITEYLSGNGNDILILSRKPVNEITGITYVSGLDDASTLLNTIELSQEEGIIIKKNLLTEGDNSGGFQKGNKNIKVTYKYGNDDFVDTLTSEILNDVKEAVIYLTAKQVLIQIGARTGGGSLTVQSHSRNYGNRGKYTDIINNIDMMAYDILKPYFSGVVGT